LAKATEMYGNDFVEEFAIRSVTNGNLES
jgi:hypothetical protein